MISKIRGVKTILPTRSNRMSVLSVLASHRQLTDVAIVGGGPAGLATAIALRRALPGISVKVLERTPVLGPRGAMLGVGPEAMRLVEAIDPSLIPQLRALHAPATKTTLYGPDGAPLPAPGPGKGFPGPPGGPPGGPSGGPPAGETTTTQLRGPPVVSRWFRIQQTLFDHLPPGVVELGARFKSYEVLPGEEGRPDRVVVTYERTAGGQGETSQEESTGAVSELEAKILVGADGVNSLVRMALLGQGRFEGDWAKIGLDTPDSIIIRGMAENSDLMDVSAADLGLDEASLHTIQSDAGSNRWYFGGPQGVAFIIRFENFLAWSATVPLAFLKSLGLEVTFDGTSRPLVFPPSDESDPSSKSKHPLLAGQTALRVANAIGGSDFGKLRIAAISVTPERCITQHLYSTTTEPRTAKFGEGPVTLLGESMHSLGPTGVGFTLGLQDAYEFASALRDHGIGPESLRKYEERRRATLQRVYEATRTTHNTSMSNNVEGAVKAFTEGGRRVTILDQDAALEPLVPGEEGRAGAEEKAPVRP